jgi:hypothetical protein
LSILIKGLLYGLVELLSDPIGSAVSCLFHDASAKHKAWLRPEPVEPRPQASRDTLCRVDSRDFVDILYLDKGITPSLSAQFK